MKTKMYSNQPRKPMMYGGDSRKKMQDGGGAMSDKRVMQMTADVTGGGKLSDADVERQLREELKRNNTKPELRKIAAGNDRDAAIAKSILREMGDKGAMPPGDQQPTE